MTMFALALLVAAAQTTAGTPVKPPASAMPARAQVMIRIVQAAEVREGQSASPHQRRMRHDEAGRPQLLLEFE